MTKLVSSEKLVALRYYVVHVGMGSQAVFKHVKKLRSDLRKVQFVLCLQANYGQFRDCVLRRVS